MPSSHHQDSSINEGLKALIQSAFPKTCNHCGRTYQSADEFFTATNSTDNEAYELQATTDDHGEHIVELFRGCECGHTLTNAFGDRRDISEAGIKRRENFERLMCLVEKQHGVERSVARHELLKIMRGQTSSIINSILPPR